MKDIDTAAELASGEQGVLDPVEALCIWFVAPKSHFQTLTYAYSHSLVNGSNQIYALKFEAIILISFALCLDISCLL